MIKKLIIQNFRSIKDVEIEFSKINAFIGPNNAGKSNIMKALNFVLGETYPTVRSFDQKDFYIYNTNNPIIIKALFNNHLESDTRVCGFKLIFDGNECNYTVINQDGNELTHPSRGNPIKVSNAMKEEVTLMYLSLDRQASQQIRPSQWTLYGKLLKHIHNQINGIRTSEFKDGLQKLYKDKIYSNIQYMEDILKEHVQKQTGLDLTLKLSLLNPIEVIKNLRPYFIEEGLEFDVEEVGAGVQSALAIAIARAYSQIVRKSLIIAIEEPELYLHPHGCRQFYKLLKNIAEEENIQIIYTTHERSFVDIADFKNIHIVRKENNETKVYSGINLLYSTNYDEVKIASKFDEYINEVFFTEYVVLVEGYSDKIACKLALEKLGVDVDLKNISIIDCGSKTAIKPIAEILKHFNIKTYVLIDSDADIEKSELQNLLGNDYVFIQDPDLEGMLGREKLGLRADEKLNKEKSLRLLPKYFEENHIPPIYEYLKQRMGF